VLAVKRRIDSNVLLRVVAVPKNLVLMTRSLKKKRIYIEAMSSAQTVAKWGIGKVLTMEQRKDKQSLYYL
jgi:hypothetical protein